MGTNTYSYDRRSKISIDTPLQGTVKVNCNISSYNQKQINKVFHPGPRFIKTISPYNDF